MERTIQQINTWLEFSESLEDFLKWTKPTRMLEQGASLEDFKYFLAVNQRVQIACSQIWYGWWGRGLNFQEQMSSDLTGLSNRPKELKQYVQGIANFLAEGEIFWGLDKE